VSRETTRTSAGTVLEKRSRTVRMPEASSRSVPPLTRKIWVWI
jgi:hypothetical protein